MLNFIFTIDVTTQVLAVLFFILELLLCWYVLLHKRYYSSATFWIIFILFAPLFGLIFYFIFGHNRIRRSATSIMSVTHFIDDFSIASELKELKNFKESGELVQTFSVPHQAYVVMLEKINKAQHEILLSTYIFNDGVIGGKFCLALEKAKLRGVEVKVLVDGLGLLYSFPFITKELKKRGLEYRIFLKVFNWNIGLVRFLNLRNHTKLLIIDGDLVFIGGLNIKDQHPPDCHFSFRGPIVENLRTYFYRDWNFLVPQSKRQYPKPIPASILNEKMGPLQIIHDGPHLPYGKLLTLFSILISRAQRKISIVSPYFLPEISLSWALKVAALRGVKVEIIIPQKNNLPWLQWALMPNAQSLSDFGVNLYFSPGEFDHSKLFLVDESQWVVGSSNWDSRSFHLNFETNIHGTGGEMAKKLKGLIENKISRAHLIPREFFLQQNLLVRTRNHLAQLFLPFM
jgi:cardiolipin synthase